MYKKYLALNDLQRLICHKAKTKLNYPLYQEFERLKNLLSADCNIFNLANSGDLESVKYPYIAITPRSTLTQNGST